MVEKIIRSIYQFSSGVCPKIVYFFNWGTPVFPSGLANLKRNPGENFVVGLIPLKSIVIFKQAQITAELSFRADSWSRSESAGINSTVRSYLYLVNRTPIDDPVYGEELGKMRVDK